MVSRMQKSTGLAKEEEEAYGNRLGFPTLRRPEDYKRLLMTGVQAEEYGVDEWFYKNEDYERMIGDVVNTNTERKMVRRLLFTWMDLFVVNPEEMPVTDLVMHTIPTYDHIRPIKVKDRLYSPKEIQWQRENIPRLLKAGVISYCDSPWSARRKHPVKKDGSLRMVNIFCPVNSATIKSNYPMKRIEPVVNLLSQEKYKLGPKFQADATNGYYAIPLWSEHAYKTAFSCSLGQFCYNVMGQGLSRAPHTYSRLKDIAMGPIPEPKEEDAIHGELVIMDERGKAAPGKRIVEGNRIGEVAFEYFMDDDYGAATDFPTLFRFLHDKYFPRISWARLTLKPKKTKFFCSVIEVLGYELQPKGLRPSIDKVAKIRDYPVPTNEAEVEQFLYMTTYLKRFIPGRAEHAKRMKEAVTYEKLEQEQSKGGSRDVGQRKKRKKAQKQVKKAWTWTSTQQESFDAVKKAIIDNVTTGGDVTKQYHLSCDASMTGIGAVLFQLTESPPGTTLKNVSEMRIGMFISQRLSDVERRYLNTEREALSVLRALEEVRWLVVGSPYPVKVYTDHSALLSILRGEGSHQGRITSWMMRLSEYTVEYHHIKGIENKLADGLSRMKPEAMNKLREPKGDWVDVAMVEVPSTEEIQLALKGWEVWLQDEWYGKVVEYLLTGSFNRDVRNQQSEKLLRQAKRAATRYRILEAGEGENTKTELLYRETTGEWARCIQRSQVEKILWRYHDVHGHFARDMTLRMQRGKYYWPTRI